MVKILRKFRILPTWKNNWVKQLGKNWYAEMKKKFTLTILRKYFTSILDIQFRNTNSKQFNFIDIYNMEFKSFSILILKCSTIHTHHYMYLPI